jgi:hypothetical protein
VIASIKSRLVGRDEGIDPKHRHLGERYGREEADGRGQDHDPRQPPVAALGHDRRQKGMLVSRLSVGRRRPWLGRLQRGDRATRHLLH